MGWCLYELIYLVTLSSVTFVFCGYSFYNLVRWRISKCNKAIALHFISMFLIGFGYLVSEYFIDYYGQNSCQERESVSSQVMLVSTIFIMIMCFVLRKKQYILNCPVNKILVFLDAALLLAVLLFVVIPEWKDFIKLITFLFSVPFEILSGIIAYAIK